MSSYARSTASRGENKFCGVCQKKGLPKSVYTSHFTKSVPGEKGIVTCPTILNAVCSFCRQKGHWADEKFCSAMRAENKRNRRASAFREESCREESCREERERKGSFKEPISLNPYAMLAEEENGPSVPSVPSVPAVPAVPAVPVTVPKPITTPVTGVSWAAMAGRPVALPKPVEKPLAEGFVVLGSGGGYKPTNERKLENNYEKEAIARDIYESRMKELQESDEWYPEEYDDNSDDEENWYGGVDNYANW